MNDGRLLSYRPARSFPTEEALKIGIGIPEQSIGFDGAVLRDYAVAAEELGFDYLTCVDHVLGTPQVDRDPPFDTDYYDETSVFHEPLTLFAFLAAVTNHIELASAVLVLPQRQTALVAKQVAEIALLSDHRLRLGVGTGWNYVEYESLNTDYKSRGRRLEEQVLLLRRLWSEPLLELDTEFHRIDRAGLNPLLSRPVPIWFGGFAEVQQDRCARIGDGMMWMGNTSLSRAGIQRIRAGAEEIGRDPDSIGFQANIGPSREEPLAGALRSWQAAGGTHATVGVGTRGRSGRDLIDGLHTLREAVGELID